MNVTSTISRTRVVVGLGAALLALAACGDDPSGSGEAPSSAQVAENGLVTTQEVEGVGTVLADAEGNALYTTEAEADGSIKCVDGCADFWPPLTPDDGEVPASLEGVSGEFDVVERPDGTEQVTLDGQPLYTFSEDQGPGNVSGDGFEDDFQGTHFVWNVMVVDDAPADQGGDSTDNGTDEGTDEGTDDGSGGDTETEDDPYDYSY